MFYKKIVLFINGKNNSDDGKQEQQNLRRRSEQYAEIKAQKGKTIDNSITQISVNCRIKLSGMIG
jgi:hypothetical protein